LTTLDLEKQYARIIAILKKTGVTTLLPRSGTVGITGIDGGEYPVPSREQLKAVLAENRELVDRKGRQGFTRLQLTPIAISA
jgi:hypothetical protein